jgi:drug/metabolite transporter (DMT)-like permease
MMKKIMTVSVGILICFVASAHDGSYQVDNAAVEIASAIFVVGMFMYFIITVLKQILEHRLKNKIIDKGISENIASSILHTTPVERGNAYIKWFAILAGLGLGLMGVNYTEPLGFHSLAIMAFSISLSFLGYYLFTKNTER